MFKHLFTQSRIVFSSVLLLTILSAFAGLKLQHAKATPAGTAAQPLKQELQQHFRRYEITSIDLSDAARRVREGGTLEITTAAKTFDLQLTQNDLRASNYRAEEVSADGYAHELPIRPVRTWKGTVRGSANATARFTIDDATLEGLIITDTDWYFVEAAHKYSASANTDEFLVYKASDVIPDANMVCGTTLKAQVDAETKRTTSSFRPEVFSPMREIEIATEADYEYVTALGGSGAANSEILSIMNQVQGIYESQIGLTFKVVFQHTWATAAEPYSITGDSAAMLNEFTNYWNTNFTSTSRDVTHLWTGRSMDSAGLAWLGVICSAPTYSYGLSIRVSTSPFRITVPAHEIGHNLNATHSDGVSGCDNTIMQSVATPSTVMSFCQFSINEITTYATNNSSCLAVASSSPHVQFESASSTVSEGAGAAVINVTRSGDTTSTGSVDYITSDGTAHQTSDYTVGAGTITFAPGETTHQITVLISDDLYPEGSETINLTLSNPTGVTIGSPATTTVTIIDNDSVTPTTNPLDTAQFFVRQHYYDFLNRLPDQPGLDYWTSQITNCGNNQPCVNARRIDVSNAFFFELEFQQTGAYVYRMYRAAFGNDQPFPNPDPGADAKKIPSYSVFVRDRARVVASSDLAQSQLALASAFVQRAEFLSRYPANLSGAQFVDALLARISSDSGADLSSQRTALISLFNQSGRGGVLYRLADDNVQTNPINNRAFIDAEYNRSFVYTQYAGYLRRDSDIGGFLFWLSQVNQYPIRNATVQHSMVCSFVTSAEYQQRFSPVVTHSNAECN